VTFLGVVLVDNGVKSPRPKDLRALVGFDRFESPVTFLGVVLLVVDNGVKSPRPKDLRALVGFDRFEWLVTPLPTDLRECVRELISSVPLNSILPSFGLVLVDNGAFKLLVKSPRSKDLRASVGLDVIEWFVASFEVVLVDNGVKSPRSKDLRDLVGLDVFEWFVASFEVALVDNGVKSPRPKDLRALVGFNVFEWLVTPSLTDI